MGKSLKGKDLGRGITQRSDGMYAARFVASSGKRHEQHFKKLADAKKWLADAKYEDRHGELIVAPNMTVDEWFQYWMENLLTDRAPNTRRNYRERYRINVQPIIGKMKLSKVKPMHCKAVFNQMEDKYAGSTMQQAYIQMGVMFRCAIDNDLIRKHPLEGVRFAKPVRAADDVKCFTVEEQREFMSVAKDSHNYRQYAFLLETGLRTGELIGLTWDSVDWEKRTLTISKSLEYRHATKQWRAGPPKTASGYRTIPLSNKAYEILTACYSERDTRKESPLMNQKLEYTDSRTGEKRILHMHDLVFVNFRTGEPAKNSSYDTHLYKLCDTAGIRRLSMHALRHTFATRAIEDGIPPKILQKYLGHSSIKTTMDRYVHVSDTSMRDAILKLESVRKNAV